jgi:hypothetical protein
MMLRGLSMLAAGFGICCYAVHGLLVIYQQTVFSRASQGSQIFRDFMSDPWTIFCLLLIGVSGVLYKLAFETMAGRDGAD